MLKQRGPGGGERAVFSATGTTSDDQERLPAPSGSVSSDHGHNLLVNVNLLGCRRYRGEIVLSTRGRCIPNGSTFRRVLVAQNWSAGKIERACHSAGIRLSAVVGQIYRKIDIGPKQWFYQCNDIKATTPLKYPERCLLEGDPRSSTASSREIY